MTNHKQVSVVIDGKEEMIDEKLVRLIEEVNRVGLKTLTSCQGSPEYKGMGRFAYISLDLNNVEGIFIKDFGKKLVIWWEMI